jgi:OFA family oxalate/formate antiporter-like MFS transporter
MDIIREPVFWVMYLMFVLVAAGGLMAVAQLAPIAKDFKIAEVPVSILGLTIPALTFALTIDRVLNGLTTATGNWHAVFLVAGIMNIAAALLAWFVLRPMRRKVIEASAAEAALPGAPRAAAA